MRYARAFPGSRLPIPKTRRQKCFANRIGPISRTTRPVSMAIRGLGHASGRSQDRCGDHLRYHYIPQFIIRQFADREGYVYAYE